jgi:hypothetical protein
VFLPDAGFEGPEDTGILPSEEVHVPSGVSDGL